MANERSTVVVIDGRPFTLVKEQGVRSYQRISRKGQHSDPGIIKSASWRLWGPMGVSRELAPGQLGVDFSDMDHRHPGQLVPPPARNALTLSGSDPLSGAGLPFQLPGRLGRPAAGGNTTFIDEDSGYLFFTRGDLVTQVNPDTWAVITTVRLQEVAKSVAQWRGETYIAQGAGRAIQRRILVSSTGRAIHIYEDVVSTTPSGDVLADAMVAGPDALFFSVGDGATDGNKVKFSPDDLVSLSNAFQVSDASEPATGMGSLGPFVFVGTKRGLYSFTKLGEPVQFLKELELTRSTLNASRQAEQFGWLYTISEQGLWAVRPDGSRGRVGLESLEGYEGPIGTPRAVAAVAGELFVSYFDGTDARTLRGRLGPLTDSTGLPDWYGFFKHASVQVDAIGATGLPSNLHILIGEDDDLARFLTARDGKDLRLSGYNFGAGTFEHYMTTLQRSPAMLKSMREWRLNAEGLSRANFLQLHVLIDDDVDGAGYQKVGANITGNGHVLRLPRIGRSPGGYSSFHRVKPRLTTTVASATASPPLVRGDLELIYEERPARIINSNLVVQLGAPGRSIDSDMEWLEARLDPAGQGAFPAEVQLPGESAKRFSFLQDVAPRDFKSGRAAQVEVLSWPSQT